MNYEEKWETIKLLGSGGQGKVFLVRNKLEALGIQSKTLSAFRNLSGLVSSQEKQKLYFDELCLGIKERIELEKPSKQGALKILHKPDNARDFELEQERIENEIKSMYDITHPNLLRIIDYDKDSEWFVSEYHPNGSISKNPQLFRGDLLKTLNAVKPLINGIAKLHKKGQIHRDIKPQNIFIDFNGNLILGDFGLIYFQDEQHSRFSKEFSNVGSRDWMPPWAYGRRIDNIEPSFDIFSISKVIWSMVSGIPILPLWYYDRDEFNLENIFPDSSQMKFMNLLFKKCIVENESDCISDINLLHNEINEVITKIENKANIISTNIERRCKVCGKGKYVLIVDRDRDQAANFGLIPQVGDESFKIFTCDYCGHVQLFAIKNGNVPPAWH